ncbi:hypothetical protein ACXR0O_24650 [Verrucomicrobiota bacterium sgz303538]
MDIYLFCFCLGFLGFAVMTFLGLSHSLGDGHHGGAGAHGHDVAHGHTGHSHHVDHGANHSAPAKLHGNDAKALWMLLSPRVLFALLLGFGASGLLFRAFLSGPLLLVVAVVAAWIFQAGIVEPLWKFFFGFASTPARTLEHAILEQAKAVANFDTQGQGLVALELDGQIVQMLGRLEQQDREQGVRIRSGDRLMIVSVDSQRNRCTVTRLRN